MSLPVLQGVAPDAPSVILPRLDTIFRARADRLRGLAQGHASSDWLLFLARVCDAQHATNSHLGWEAALARITADLRASKLPEAARAAIARLEGASDERRAAWAAALDDDAGRELPDGAVALFVAAAQAVERTARAAAGPAPDVVDARGDCPLCGAAPAAGVITGDTKTRYLVCSRCAAAWRRLRVQCATCGAAGGLTYFTLEGEAGAGVKAEACAGCKSYLKLFYEEARPGVEALADDAATLALDVLMGEAGWARAGANPLVRADVRG
jgi:FdhE protein